MQLRALGAIWLAVSAAMTPGVGGTVVAADAGVGSPDVGLTAVLDGEPISLKLVGRYYCDDFSWPVIQCSAKAATIEARAALALLSGTTYVTMYDQMNYSGAYMHVSEDYSALVIIGWSDRVSSFRGRNSETGQFFTDWFYGGSSWPFCCNSYVSSLGGYDNTFSSVHRT